MLNDNNFKQEIENKNLVLIDFFANYCEPCLVLAPILEKVMIGFDKKIELIKVNINDIPLTAKNFNIQRIPLVVLFKKGKLIDGFIGLKSEEEISNWLKEKINQEIKMIIKEYEKYAQENGFKLNPDQKVVERVINGLLENEKKYNHKYCPCRRIEGNEEVDKKNICPCIFHKQEIEKEGKCYCNLFVK